MAQSLIEYRINVIVREGIINDLSVSAIFDELRLLQDAQLVGNRRLVHIQKLCNITYTELTCMQYIQYFNSRLIAKYLKGI